MIPHPVSRRRILVAAALPIVVVLLFAVLLVSAARRISVTARTFDESRDVESHLEHILAHLAITSSAAARLQNADDTTAARQIEAVASVIHEDFGQLRRLQVAAESRVELLQLEADVLARVRLFERSAKLADEHRYAEARQVLGRVPAGDIRDLIARVHTITHRELAGADARWRRARATDHMVVALMLLGGLLSIGATVLSGLWLTGQVRWLSSLTQDLERKSAALTGHTELIERSNAQLREAADSYLQQKRATEQARQHAREVLFSMTPAMLVLDSRWRVSNVTEEAAVMLSRHPDELLTNVVWSALPELGGNFEQELLRSVSGQIPLYFEQYISCWDKWIEFRTLPYTEGVAVYLNDTTPAHRHRELREQLLKRIEHAATEWQQLFDGMDVPIVVLDPHGTIIRMNEVARQLAGKEFSHLIGGNIRDVGTDELWQMAGTLAGEASADARAREVRAHDASSGRTWEIRATFFAQPQDGAPRVIVKARDVTEIIALEYSLAMADKLSTVGMVTAGVAHEVRNPLFSISSLVDAMDSSFPDRAELRPFMERLRRQVDRMRDLMTDLLEYGKASTPDQARGDVRPVIEAAVANSYPFTRGGVNVLTSLKDELPEISMDAARLELVFRNLVENAIQHSEPDGAVELTVSVVRAHSKRWIECSVLDRGPGFAPADLPHVFEPFFTRRKGGTGLGLSIVQRIVLEHQGSIRAANRPEGGACVTVRLPVADLAASAPANQEVAYAGN